MIDVNDILKIKASSLREAITIYFQEAITGGVLNPGDSLPSSRDLAQQLNTSYPNVHQALVPLVKSGLLLRDRKKGTIVRERKKELRCVAIYIYRINIDDMPQFQHVLIDQLTNQLAKQNISTRLVLDNELSFGMSQLRKWAMLGEIQGIMVPIGGTIMTEALKKIGTLPIPVVKADDILFDMAGMATKAISVLKEEQCSRIGVVSTVARLVRNSQNEWVESDFYKDLRKNLAQCDLEMAPERIRMIRDESQYFHSAADMIDFAFDQCNQLLTLPPELRPDGLFVFPDQMATGIMLSIMKNNVKVPEELKLVLHRNWEVKVPVFAPCSMIGISIAENAAMMIDNLFAAFQGKPLKTHKIEPELRKAIGR